ncbi:MAG TPA: sigma-54-dependent Fis family transcriptional regulator [Pirellulales bacterium]|jgi:Nif-specific regulatory protein|nr:sigma-54-dependent Fis family transcriptional regulator [Pirellulales bacterium]
MAVPHVPANAGSFQPLEEHPELASIAADLLWRASQQHRVDEFLATALPLVIQATGADFAALVSSDSGHWSTVARLGHLRPLPIGLLADVLDRESAAVEGSWVASPLVRHATSGELLLLHGALSRPSADSLRSIEALAAVLASALETVRRAQHEHARIGRLEAILEIASQWNKTSEMEPLLKQMAEAATRLLGADRASIFLWDRPNHTLVGRPALGVESGELRIPDNSGVVGQVVHTGQARRVSTHSPDSEINRQVDRQLGYQTRTLVCVPLRGSKGELFGAFEVINKLDGEFTTDDELALTELASHAAVALENTQQFTELLSTHRQVVEQAAEGVQLIGRSPAIEALRSTIRRVATTELAILILGENGTGKEVVSQSIHYLSPRREQPFIAVNCAAITETLLESELFGHEKGAFTDAHETRQGKFELAAGGTLFLDEIGDLSLSGQGKLLRVLEEKVVVRVGGSKPIHTDARVIAATNQNLAEMVRQRRFRQDLYFRLNVVTLELPPLVERGDDVTLLGEYFLADFCRRAHRKLLPLAPAAKRRLEQHLWPGNVRELRNLMERLAYLLPGDTIEAADLAFILSPAGQSPAFVAPDLPLSEATDRFQIEYIKKAIERAKQNMSLAAERLGLHRSNLYRKMRQLGMNAGDDEA